MNNIKQLIEKSRKSPELAPVYAMEFDRQLRGMSHAPLTFSAKALGDGNPDTARALGLNNLFDALPTQQSGSTIYQAEILAKEGKLSGAIAYAFLNAHGSEVNALNLLYANHASTNPKLRLHFLNKYLGSYGLEIHLEEGGAKDFFHSIKSKKSPTKVDGPLVSVIMPAHNAEGTIELAVGSLLSQTWHNLQIIIVDDASTDGTLQKAKDLAKYYPRVEVLTSPINVGPYVCRNLGVLHTRGQWLTVHDADDWAFPDRIEQQVNALTKVNALACIGHMLRINEHGQITRPVSGASNKVDGYLRLCFVSLMVQTNYFRTELGAWDSVRVGGDAELIDRLISLGTSTTHLRQPIMLCLDHESSLTNHQVFGLTNEIGQTQPMRIEYKNSFSTWHKTLGTKKLSSFGKVRPFDAPTANSVDQDTLKKVFATWAKNLDLINASELFDAVWYRSQYPEVEQSGLEAAEHYLVYGKTGATDPSLGFSSRFYLLSRSLKTNPLVHHLRGKDGGPNPKRVLLAAAEVAKTGLHKRGIALAEAHLPDELAYTAHILKANEALDKGNEEGWQEHLNAYLAHFNVKPICLEAGDGTVFDRLNTSPLPPVTEGPLITVIMPAWNAEKTVRKAAQSILNQTWRNLELLIVDDASTDGTWTVLQEIAATDMRVKIAHNKTNVGPYASKNIALTHAQGDWITGHDADDWALPQRLEQHIKYALSQTKPMLASVTHMLRITPAGVLNHLGQVGAFNIDGAARKASISCLLKRDFMVERLGFWDCVRFGGDSELIARARIAKECHYQELPLIGMICLDLESSLTNNAVYGVDKQFGAKTPRLVYGQAWKEWHGKLSATNLRLEFASSIPRPFPAPYEAIVHPLKIRENLQELKLNFSRKVNVAILTDLSFPGGNASSTLDEIEFLLAKGLSVLLIDCRGDRNSKAPRSSRYDCYHQITQQIQLVKRVNADVMILRHPVCLTSKQLNFSEDSLNCRTAFFVINNSRYLTGNRAAYDTAELGRRIRAFPAENKFLCPISDLIRVELSSSGDVDGITFSTTNWHPTFDPNIYEGLPKFSMRPPFVIGRHGRDAVEKWLEDPHLLSKAYPQGNEFQVSILGGVDKLTRVLGYVPENWEVIPFGQLTPKDFLQRLDVFVYFPHSSLVEAFGRTIVEAMLAGLPVILPQRFKVTFGDIPLYCEPEYVSDLVRKLARDNVDRVAYLTEVQQIAKETFGREAITSRLQPTGKMTGPENLHSPAVRALSTASSNYRASLLSFELCEDTTP